MGRRNGGRIAATRRYAAVVGVWQCPRCLARLKPGENCGCWPAPTEVEQAQQPSAAEERDGGQ
jgi:hypothetical protein